MCVGLRFWLIFSLHISSFTIFSHHFIVIFTSFFLFMHIKVVKLCILIILVFFYQNWALKLNLDKTRNACNGSFEVMVVGDLVSNQMHILKLWEPRMGERLLVHTRTTRLGPVNAGQTRLAVLKYPLIWAWNMGRIWI